MVCGVLCWGVSGALLEGWRRAEQESLGSTVCIWLSCVCKHTRVAGDMSWGVFAPVLVCGLMRSSAYKMDSSERSVSAAVIILGLQDYVHNPHIHHV